MRRKRFQVGILWRLVIALILTLCLFPISSNPVFAQSPGDYFELDYDVEFSSTEIEGSEVFYATITADVTCTNDLPWSASEASITGRIIAEHQIDGSELTLNSSYTITIKPFPSDKGETAQSIVVVPLQFPQGGQYGTYSVVGELIEAKVKVLVWISVTAFLSSSQTMGSVTYLVGNGASVVGGVGSGGGGGLAGVTPVRNFITEQGRFTEVVTAISENRKVELYIPKDTIGKKMTGSLLTSISIVPYPIIHPRGESVDPPTPPEQTNVIGLIYEIGPYGATFDPPIYLTIKYDASVIPQGIAVMDLVVATFDKKTGEWVELESTANPDTDTVTAKVSHFSPFTILAHTRPISFTATDLSVTPKEANLGESVTISVLVTNISDLTISHKVTLTIDNVAVAAKDVTLDGGDSQTVTFTTAKDAAGTYTVTVDGLSGTFLVRGLTTFAISKLSVTPAEVVIGEEVTISTFITNTGNFTGSYKATLKIDNVLRATKVVTLEVGASEEVTFTVAEHTTGTHTVTVDGLSGTFLVGRPAVFTASKLSITPAEVVIGEEVIISILVTNTGGLSGSHKVILKIDNEVAATKEVTLEVGASEEATFTTAKDAAGTYTVTVDGLSGIFTVKTGEALIPGPAIPVNWGLFGSIITGCIILGLVVYFFVWRKRGEPRPF